MDVVVHECIVIVTICTDPQSFNSTSVHFISVVRGLLLSKMFSRFNLHVIVDGQNIAGNFQLIACQDARDISKQDLISRLLSIIEKVDDSDIPIPVLVRQQALPPTIQEEDYMEEDRVDGEEDNDEEDTEIEIGSEVRTSKCDIV